MAYGLVGWLNLTKGKKSHSRMVKLLEAAKALAKPESNDLPTIVASLRPSRPPRVIGTRTQKANLRQRIQVVRGMNKLLARHRVYAQYRSTRRGRWTVSWNHLSNREKVEIVIFAGGNYDTFPYGEGDALQSIIKLAEEGFLGRVRTCDVCGRWYFARFEHQLFCQTPCQQKNFRSTPKFRAQWRDYMRDYRRTLQEMGGGQIKAVKS